MKRQFYIGSYARKEEEGIYSARFDEETGQMDLEEGTIGIENPSFLTLDREGTTLLAVSEVGGSEHGSVISYSRNPERGRLEAVTELSTLGGSPCHLIVDQQQRFVITTNYMGGNVCSFKLGEDSVLAGLADHVTHTGRGPRDDRQEAAHPHSAIVDRANRFVLVADLGTDKLVHYRLEGETGRLIAHHETKTAPGAGPRHFAFHPDKELLYVVNELDCTVSVYNYDSESSGLTLLQVISTLPESYTGESTCADIHLTSDGRYLYASNRGHDSLAVYQVLQDGQLAVVEYASSGGRTPRNFAITADNRYVLIANQDSNNIVSCRIDPESGRLQATGHEIQVKAPVCICLV
ncbi:lactonase family protein [Paenibacillus solisilvae]|uniref:Lactonase family protein n=1 Tax=Paenibacillus solisilvae TaxID=2486751 RepID=A0ABW0VXH8_9BACL